MTSMTPLERAALAVGMTAGTHCGNCEQQLPDAENIARAVLLAIREPLKQWAATWPESGSGEFDSGFAQGIGAACDFIDDTAVETSHEG